MRSLRFFYVMFFYLFAQGCAHVEVTPMLVPSPGLQYKYEQGNHLNYKVIGTGDTSLVFLHGFAASSDTWYDILPFFPKNKYRIYLVDLKGAGFSSKPKDGDYSITANARIIENFIIDNKIRNPIIIGQSLGGGVALLTTISLSTNSDYYPKGLVLIDSASYNIDLPFFVKYLRIPILNQLLLSLTSSDYKAEYTLNRIYYDTNKVTREKIERYSYFMRETDYKYSLIETALDVIPTDFESYIAKYKDIKAPTLIIWGNNDNVIPITNGKRLNQDINKSRLEVIQNCGHNPQEEEPSATSELILSFINSL